jgi:hypothetical protein
LRNMKAVAAVRILRQYHWMRKVYSHLLVAMAIATPQPVRQEDQAPLDGNDPGEEDEDAYDVLLDDDDDEAEDIYLYQDDLDDDDDDGPY